MNPSRQAEVAEYIATVRKCSNIFARGMLAITPEEMLVTVPHSKARRYAVMYPERVRALQVQASKTLRKLRGFKESYGRNVLAFVIACRFVERLLSCSRVVEYLTRFHPDALRMLRVALLTMRLKRTKLRRNNFKLELARHGRSC